MNLFGRSLASPLTRPSALADATALEPLRFVKSNTPPPVIALSSEQKELLQKAVDSRVDRIMQEIYADKAATEKARASGRILNFPHGDSGERIVLQGEQGIVPGAAPDSRKDLFDSL